jgi:hypothetical protein
MQEKVYMPLYELHRGKLPMRALMTTESALAVVAAAQQANYDNWENSGGQEVGVRNMTAPSSALCLLVRQPDPSFGSHPGINFAETGGSNSTRFGQPRRWSMA